MMVRERARDHCGGLGFVVCFDFLCIIVYYCLHWLNTLFVQTMGPASIADYIHIHDVLGYGYIHNGLRAQDVCSTLDMFFHERAGDVKYTVIRSATWTGMPNGD